MSLPTFRDFAEKVLDEACERFPMGYRPAIHWKRYRVTAGMAYFRTGVIGLSISVLKTEEAVRETLLHEYAHLLAVKRYGVQARGHGEPWRRAMADLGLVPKVRHSYTVERNEPRQQVSYRCLSCGAIIIRKRRLPARRRYLHAPCGGDLKLVKVARVTAPAGNA
jgi:SprT protein